MYNINSDSSLHNQIESPVTFELIETMLEHCRYNLNELLALKTRWKGGKAKKTFAAVLKS